MMGWRRGDAIVRVEKPANISRARTLGFKAKQGYSVVRVRVDKGRRTRRKTMGGRKHKNNYRFVQPGMSHQAIAEQRANRVYKNMEVLNSYWVGEDGEYKYFEVLLADASKPSVNISSVIRQGKAFRGLTSAGNSRGPSRKKQINKKLQRKLLVKKPFRFVPYLEGEGRPKPLAAPKTGIKAAAPAHAQAHQHPVHSQPAQAHQHGYESREAAPASHQPQHKPGHEQKK